MQTIPPPLPTVEERDATVSVAEEMPHPTNPNPINTNEVHESSERAAPEPEVQRSPSPIAIQFVMPEVASTSSAVETPAPKDTTVPVEQPEAVEAIPKSSFQPIFQSPPATLVDPSTTAQNMSEASPPSSPSIGGFPHKKPMEVLKKLQLRRQQSSGRYPSKPVPAKLSPEMAESLKQIRTLLSGNDFLDKCAESPDMAKDVLQRLCSLPLNKILAFAARVVSQRDFSRGLSID